MKDLSPKEIIIEQLLFTANGIENNTMAIREAKNTTYT